ncbi:hypothetical protein BH11MYX3_BH11MYX3_42170 [soil metagenome]
MVGVVAWLALIGALIVFDVTAWPALSVRPHLETLGIFAGTFFAGSVAAASMTCIVDPRRETPTIVQIAAGLIWIGGLIARATSDRENQRDPSASSSSGETSKAWDHMGLAWAIFATILALGTYAGGIALTHYLTGPVMATRPATATTKAAPSPAKPAAPVRVAVSAPTTIIEAPDLAIAIATARPTMSDARTGPSDGARSLLRYLAARARWRDVEIQTSETSLVQVEKDPPSERGKRLCVAGTLARIEKVTLDGAALYSARLTTREQDSLEVIVVGSTGALVKRKPARFCGVVTGALDVGGQTSTFAVGMFDLPANR